MFIHVDYSKKRYRSVLSLFMHCNTIQIIDSLRDIHLFTVFPIQILVRTSLRLISSSLLFIFYLLYVRSAVFLLESIVDSGTACC